MFASSTTGLVSRPTSWAKSLLRTIGLKAAEHHGAPPQGSAPPTDGVLAPLNVDKKPPVACSQLAPHFDMPGATAASPTGDDFFFGIPYSDYQPHVIDSLAAILNFGFFPYDGVDQSQKSQAFRPTPQLSTRPDVADGFRRFVRAKAAELRQAGDAPGAVDVERIAAESTLLDDGRMMFRNGTKLAFHEMPQCPGCEPLLAVNFAGMSATRRDGAGTGERFRGDVPTSLRQVRHVVRSVVTGHATSNTRLVRLLGEYIRSRPEDVFAYGHSMGGAFAEQLSNQIAAWNRVNPEAAGKRVAFMAFQSATLQASDVSRALQAPYVARRDENDPREVRCCHVQSPRDLIGQFQGTRAFKWAAGQHVAAPVGTRIDVLRDSNLSPVQQHDRVYQLLAEDLQRNPKDLRRLLDHLGDVYRYSTRAARGAPLGAR